MFFGIDYTASSPFVSSSFYLKVLGELFKFSLFKGFMLGRLIDELDFVKNLDTKFS